MKINFLSLLKWQTDYSYLRQSGMLLDGYIQQVWSSGIVKGFIVPFSTDTFGDTEIGFFSKGDQIFITKGTLRLNDIINEVWKVIEEVEVVDLIGLNVYSLKKLV